MKHYKILVPLICAFILSIAAAAYFKANKKDFEISEEDKSMVMTIADTMARCSGYFLTMSWLAEIAEKPETAVNLKNNANGWQMASSYVLYSTGAVPIWSNAIQYSESLAETTAQGFKSQFELHPEAVAEEQHGFYKKECEPLADYQVAQVMEIRKLMAMSDGQPK